MRADETGATIWRSVLLSLSVIGFGGVARAETPSITVNDPRPVARAVTELQSKTGWAITYEDPAYVHASELADVTAQVRQDHQKSKKVLIPRGGTLSLTYRLPNAQGSAKPLDIEGALEDAIASALVELVRIHGAARGGPMFTVLESNGMFHVVPTRSVNASGRVQKAKPLLDATVSLPAKLRTGTELIEEICESLSSATGQTVIVGAIPHKLLGEPTAITATEQTARSILSRFLLTLPVELSWRLLHDPGSQWYVLNFHVVPTPTQ